MRKVLSVLMVLFLSFSNTIPIDAEEVIEKKEDEVLEKTEDSQFFEPTETDIVNEEFANDIFSEPFAISESDNIESSVDSETETNDVDSSSVTEEEYVDVIQENTEIQTEIVEPTNTPEIIEEVEVIETPKPTEIPEEIIEVSYPYFLQEKTINDVTITVEAPEDVFPEGSTLSVEQVPVYVERQVTEAIDQVRDNEKNVAVSYTFDIKVLDQEGNEVQPKDMNKVKVSFKMVEVQNENLSTDVYHIDDKQDSITTSNVTSLDAVTDEDVATVETDGFSLYTVEFTYNNKQYILEGDTYVKLEEVLSAVNLSGEVTSYEVSNPSLFNIFKGDEDGINYDVEYIDEIEYATPIDNPDGNVLYVVALKMFNTEEWLNVAIDDITYHIVVTDDAYVNGQTHTKITDSRVVQIGNETNFTATMPLATIFVNEDIINTDSYKLLPPTFYTQEDYDNYVAENGQAPSWSVGDINYDIETNTGMIATYVYSGAKTGLKIDNTSTSDGYGQLYFDFSAGSLSYGSNLTDDLWSGPVVEYRFVNAAERFNVAKQQYEKMDVIITYSNIHISLQDNLSSTNYDKLTKFDILDANKIRLQMFASRDLGNSANDRAGLKLDINVKVVDKDNNLVDGSYYFPLVDADVQRANNANFSRLYQATTAENNNYSEMFMLMSNYGQPTSTGSWEQKIWIPGGDYNANQPASQDNNMPYLSIIDSVNGNLRVKPGADYDGIPQGGYVNPVPGSNTKRDNDFYTGFATLANNTAGGINFRYWGSSGNRAKPAGSGTVLSYVLAGTQRINHKLDASSDTGGTIYTTSTGNSDGTLSGGELIGNNKVNQPYELSAATGQNVTYTLSPNGGYRIKNVYVKTGDIDILSIVENAKNSINPAQYDSDNSGDLDQNEQAQYDQAVQNAIDNAVANDENASKVAIGSLNYKGKGVYAYTFSGIHEDNSIHVDWEKTELSVKKELNPHKDDVSQKFNFQIRLWDTSTQESQWRVRARKYNGDLIKDNTIGEETPYYMSYYESHNEYGDVESYNAVAQADIDESTNPAEEGWYEAMVYQAHLGGGVHEDRIRYVPTADEEPYIEYDEETGDEMSRKVYYRREVTQADVQRHFQHILGYNEETNLWESYDVKSTMNNESDVDLGLINPETQLNDNYRYEILDGKVWLVSSRDSENDTYTKYLMWIYDDVVDGDVLVAGNEELYPDGIAYDPNDSNDNYIYIWDGNVEGFSGKIIRCSIDVDINGQSYSPNSSSNKYKYEKDINSPVYYDFVANPEGYQLDSGYTKIAGETGMYIITLPAGQSPDLSAFDGLGWDIFVAPVRPTGEVFDMDAAFTEKGATVSGVNTYSFTLGVNETIDFEGCVPMGYNYEITEILPANSIWELEGTSGNDTVNDFDGEEDVIFTNKERKYDITIEKQTVDNKAGTFDFTIKIYKEEVVTPAQNQSITIQAYKNSGEVSPTYKLTNSGDPIALEMNGISTIIPTGEYTKGSGSPLDLVISDLLDMDNTSNVQITMNGDSGNVSTMAVTSVTDQVQAMIDDGYTSFSLEPITFTLSTPDITNKTWYTPSTVPAGFNGTSGTFTFTLDNNESKTFTNIPYGYKYEIKETVSTGWENVDKNNEAGTLTSDVTSTWTNDLTKHILKITKETVNNVAGSFSFKVKVFNGSANFSLPSEFGQPDANGYYTFTLTNDSSKDVVNIPYGYSYEIYELDANGNVVSVGSNIGSTDWKLKSIDGNGTGTIIQDTEVTFTNELVHDLTITKETTDNISGSFNFKIKAWLGENGSEEYIDMSAQLGNPDSNGYYSFAITNGQSKVLSELPHGMKYELYEETQTGWQLVDIDRSTPTINKGAGGISGTLNGDTSHTFNNMPLYSLEVIKKVTGNMGNKHKDFNFTARFWKVDGSTETPYNPTTLPQGVSSSNGIYSFTLSNNETVIFENLPYDVHYEVIESDYSSEGYTTTVDGNTSRMASGTITKDTTHTYTNRLDVAVPTEVRFPWIGGIVLTVSTILLLLLFEKVKRLKGNSE